MDNNFYSLAAIILLLAINAFFVAAEFALVKAKNFRIDLLADQGSKSALLTQRIQLNLESYLAACQLGITMASLGLGWVGEPVVAALLKPLFASFGISEVAIHTTAFILGFLLFSSLHIVIGEQVPKTFAIRKAEPVSMWSAYPLHWFYIMAYPLNWLLNKASGSILTFFNVEEATHADVLSDAEIRGIINTSEKHGDMGVDKATMLHNMFEFDTHTVQQIMVPRGEVDFIDLKADWTQNLETIERTQHSRFPVIDGNPEAPIGILLIKDLYSTLLGYENQMPEPIGVIRDNIRTPLLVPETQPVVNLFESMRRSRNHMALVMDEYGSYCGVVTMEDMLEEIVGDIADELDIDEPDVSIRWTGEYWESSGLVSVTDMERVTEVDFPNDIDANTISGLFMLTLNRMPRAGDEVELFGLRFLALDIENNRVGQVQIYRVEPSESSGITEKPSDTTEAATNE